MTKEEIENVLKFDFNPDNPVAWQVVQQGRIIRALLDRIEASEKRQAQTELFLQEFKMNFMGLLELVTDTRRITVEDRQRIEALGKRITSLAHTVASGEDKW